MRALSEYAAELGRARPRKLAPATIGRKLAAVRAFLRHSLGAERVPDASFAPRRPHGCPMRRARTRSTTSSRRSRATSRSR